jgi:hypothetical protein
MSEPTLLGRFIQEKLEGYEEPTRQGVRRGDKVGFPRKKLHAGLLALTCASLREQAAEAGIKYDLLRKWRSEPEFKEMVNQHRYAFLRYCSTVRHWSNEWNWNSSSPLRPSLDLLCRALERSTGNSKTWRELEATALTQAIEVLQDESKTMKSREQLAELFSVIYKNFTNQKE